MEQNQNSLKVIHKILIKIQGPNNPRYKTSLCKHYATPQGCGYGDKCQFAHGFAELRTTSNSPVNPTMSMNPFNDKAQSNIINYKIVKCKNWELNKTCRYGNKCTFAHGDEELRKKEDNMKNINTGIPMFVMMDQNMNPIMLQQQGLNFNQMPMQMIPGNFDPNQMIMGMGMMPQNANVPQGGNMMNSNNNESSGITDKNQQ